VNPANLSASRNMWANVRARLKTVPSTLRGGYSVTATVYVTSLHKPNRQHVTAYVQNSQH
jgi:hypothetical protein